MWASADGKGWTLEDTFGDDPGEPVEVTQGPHGLESWAWSEPRQVADLFSSTDGVDWQVHRAPSGDFAVRLGGGWIVPGPLGLLFYTDDPDGPVELGTGYLRLKTDSLGAGGYGTFAISPTPSCTRWSKRRTPRAGSATTGSSHSMTCQHRGARSVKGSFGVITPEAVAAAELERFGGSEASN